MEAGVVLQRIGRIRLPASTVCVRCGSPAVTLAIKENGAVKAYCLPCVEQMKEERKQAAMTPPRVNAYLITAYQYHWLCCTCGAVRHRAAGIDPGECECGSSSWKQRLVSSSTGEPWYVQILDPTCPTCQRTANELHAMTAQMELIAL